MRPRSGVAPGQPTACPVQSRSHPIPATTAQLRARQAPARPRSGPFPDQPPLGGLTSCRSPWSAWVQLLYQQQTKNLPVCALKGATDQSRPGCGHSTPQEGQSRNGLPEACHSPTHGPRPLARRNRANKVLSPVCKLRQPPTHTPQQRIAQLDRIRHEGRRCWHRPSRATRLSATRDPICYSPVLSTELPTKSITARDTWDSTADT